MGGEYWGVLTEGVLGCTREGRIVGWERQAATANKKRRDVSGFSSQPNLNLFLPSLHLC